MKILIVSFLLLSSLTASANNNLISAIENGRLSGSCKNLEVLKISNNLGRKSIEFTVNGHYVALGEQTGKRNSFYFYNDGQDQTREEVLYSLLDAGLLSDGEFNRAQQVILNQNVTIIEFVGNTVKSMNSEDHKGVRKNICN